MKYFFLLLVTIVVTSCATQKQDFKKEKVCSDQALKYLRNPRNKTKQALQNPKLIQDISRTSHSIQTCYDDYKKGTGSAEFNTCLVVGVDQNGQIEYFNFGSKDVELDPAFLKCAMKVTNTIPFSSYGSNYILIQSYRFYVGE
jgi:hypothetical protein